MNELGERVSLFLADRAAQVEISGDEAGQRLDNFLLRRAKGVPKSHVYRIIRAEYHRGTTTIEVTPPDVDFRAEVVRRIEAVPYRVLTFYQGFGFVCFPEDYAKYVA